MCPWQAEMVTQIWHTLVALEEVRATALCLCPLFFFDAVLAGGTEEYRSVDGCVARSSLEEDSGDLQVV